MTLNPLAVFDRYVPNSLNDDERRRGLLLVRLSVVFLVLAPVVGLVTVVSFGLLVPGLVVLGLVVPVALLPYLLWHTKSLALTVSVLNASVVVALLASSLWSGGVSQPSTAWLVTLPVLAVAISGRRVALGWAAVAVAVPWVLLGGERAGALTLAPMSPERFAESAAINWTLLAVALTSLGVLAEVLRLKAMQELEQAHRVLTATREQQVMTDRLAAIGTLAAGVAHELNNPLAAAVSSAKFLHDEAREKLWGAEAEGAAQDVVEAGLRAAAIIRDLRDFAQPVTDERPSASLEVAWATANRLLRAGLRYRAKVFTELPEQLPAVRLPSSRLVQVLLNVLTNSMQAMSLSESARVTLTAALRGEFVEFTLTDTGGGMSEDTVRRAFDPFFTTRSVGEGAGLGLFVAQAIVTGCGGSIELSSVRGEGTTVRCRLPVA